MALRTVAFALALLAAAPAGADGEPDVAALRARLGSEDRLERLAAAGALADLGPAAAPARAALLEATRDESIEVRIAALTALGTLGTADLRLLLELTDLLADPNDLVRHRTVMVVGNLSGEDQARARLLAHALADPVAGTRAAAAGYLGTLQATSSPVRNALRMRIADRDHEVARAAAFALAALRDDNPYLAPLLAGYVRDSTPEEWKDHPLARTGPDREAPKRKDPLAAPPRSGPDELAGHLVALGDAGADALAGVLKTVMSPARGNAVWALSFFGPAQAGRIRPYLDDDAGSVRIVAAVAWARVSDDAAAVAPVIAGALSAADVRRPEDRLRWMDVAGEILVSAGAPAIPFAEQALRSRLRSGEAFEDAIPTILTGVLEKLGRSGRQALQWVREDFRR